MRSFRTPIIVMLIVAAVALIFWSGRLSPPQPTIDKSVVSTSVGQLRSSDSQPSSKPRQSTAKRESAVSLKDRFAELKARANGNDPAAAAELFHDVMDCDAVATMQKNLLPLALKEVNRDSSNDSAQQLEAQDQKLSTIEKNLAFVRDHQALCDGFTENSMEVLLPSMLKAAILGDPLASRCYLDSDIGVTGNLIKHPDWLEDYKRNVMTIAQAGIERGDWRVVGLLQRAQLGVFKFTLLAQMDSSDPAAAYRYLKLERLGSSGAFGESLDPMIQTSAENLSPEQIARADAWAQDTYGRYFEGTSSNVIDHAPGACTPDL